ncbi:MAG TPA: biotin/lipoyl-binding protein [Vicinamibacterales bacterium]|nr:biotin/lipoyl-binding protein [Vicinamibacterales bacterium]
MRKLLVLCSCAGLLAASVVAYVSGITEKPLPPAFHPATNPYATGIYANGIVESEQPSGQNINVYPEVAGTVKQIFVAEGDSIEVGAPLLLIDESIQRATVEQLQSQAQAALTVLAELRAQPRKETLEVAEAQVSAAEAALKTAQDALQKQQTAFELNAKAVSRDALDAAANTAATARANVDVARKQRDLTKAGAWIYDIRNQERQYAALHKSFVASSALLSKYRLVAPRAGRVLAVHASVGAFVSGQGAYDSYTQGMTPVLVLGTGPAALQVRCYVDEILVPRLPAPGKMKAQMSIRGSDVRIPLTYIRTQPLVSPKIELSDQRLERVDVRVLPIIFRIAQATAATIYAGQLVDVYIGE